MKNLDPKVKKSAKKILNLATRSKRSMQVNQMNYVRTAKFISTEARRISEPKIDKKKLKKLFNTDFASIASANLGGGGLDLPGFGLPFGGGGGRRGGRPGGRPPSRRAQQRYRRRFGNRAANRRFGRLPQFGRGGGIRVPRAGGVLGVAMAGLEYGGRVSEGQTQTQAITGTAASTAGGIAGGIGGAKGGAAIGALIGSIVPGAGTAIGAAIGGLIGGIAGGMAGSSLAGGAADKITGVNKPKIIGQEDDKKKEIDKLSVIETDAAFMATLNKFDDLLDRFGRISISRSGEPEKGGPGIALTSFTGKTLPEELTPTVLQLQEKFEKTGETQSALTQYGFVKIEATAPNRLGILGGPDLTPRISYNPNLTPKTNKEAVAQAELLFTAANLPATLSPLVSGRGAVQPRVQYGPAFQGPLPAPIASPRSRIVRGANTLPRPESTPVTPLTERLAPFLRPTPTTPRKKFTNPFEKATPGELTGQGRPRLTGGDNRAASRTAAERGKAEDDMSGRTGAMEQRANQDKQLVKFAETMLNTPADARPQPTVTKFPDGNVLTPKGVTPQQVLEGLTPAQIKEIQKRPPTLKEQLQEMKEIGDQSSVDVKPGSQEVASAAGISQYTLLNGPENNTIIVQPSGGGMPPPPAQPPQMIAQAAPLDMQMMGGGPSKLDQALALNTLITFTKLTS